MIVERMRWIPPEDLELEPVDRWAPALSAGLQTFSLPVDRFDPNLLPDDARTPGTEAFRNAVNRTVLNLFHGFRGRATVSVHEERVSVSWMPDAAAPHSAVDVAFTHLRKRRTDPGAQVLEFVLTANPDNVNILYNLGLARSKARRYGKAEDHLSRAVALAPDFIKAWVTLGATQLLHENYEGAVRSLQRAIVLEPDHPGANRDLGIALLKLGDDLDMAVLHLCKAVDSQPLDGKAWAALWDALILAEDRRVAVQADKHAISINPHNDLAEVARSANSRLAQNSIEGSVPTAPSKDAVEFCVAALRDFHARPREEVWQILKEIMGLEDNRIDPDAPSTRYRLKSLPGEFSGRQLVCLVHLGQSVLHQLKRDHTQSK